MTKSPQHSIIPKAPDEAWLRRFLAPSLLGAAHYKIDTPKVSIKLDQNESPWDWPVAIKRRIADKLVERQWNRYPSAFADDLAAKVAAYAGVSADSILLGPGSNYLISLLLGVFSKGFLGQSDAAAGTGGKLVIARPSFPLYESHCRYEGIPFETWPLDEDLEYDVARLPALTPGSMLVFASPNNPVGNILRKATLVGLLEAHPQALFVADEAYFEYTTEQYTDLLSRFSNLMLVRTFSKTLGCAGVRLGYIMAHESYLGLLRKLRLPFLLNHFTLAAADVILSDDSTKDYLEATRSNAMHQRRQVQADLAVSGERLGFRVKGSEANFLLLRFHTQELAVKAYAGLIAADILVRNVSAAPGLTGCLRVTLGDERENDALVAAFKRMS